MASASYVRIVNNSGFDFTIQFFDNGEFDSKGWSGDYSPDIQFEDSIELKNGKTIQKPLLFRNTGRKTYTLRLHSEKGVIFDLNLEQSDVGDQRMQNAKFYKEEKFIQGSSSLVVTQTSSWREYNNQDFEDKEIREFRGVLNVYLTPERPKAKTDNTLRLFLLADTHMKDDRQCYSTQMNYNVRDYMMTRPEYHQADFVYIMGDLFDNAHDHYDEAYSAVWTMSESFQNQPVLCDGYGNHDTERNFYHTTNVYEMLRARMEVRKSLIPAGRLTTSGEEADKEKDEGGDLHYWIQQPLQNEENVHLIMLNLAPGDADPENGPPRCWGAFTFLKKCLEKIGKSDPVLLFYHVRCSDGSEFYKDYFLKTEQEKLIDLLFEQDDKGTYSQKYNVVAIFNGHQHGTYYLDDDKLKGLIPTYICGGVQGRGSWEDPNNPKSSDQQSGRCMYFDFTYDPEEGKNSITYSVRDAAALFPYLP